MSTLRIERLAAHNPGPMTGDGNSTYLVVSDGPAVLIDAGTGDPRHLESLDRALGQVRLEHVIVTHDHSDHASGTPAVRARHPDARFWIHPCAAAAPAGVVWRPLSDGVRVSAGSVELMVLHTPGHSPDHVTLWHEDTRTAFSGDLLIAGGSVMIQASRGGRLGDYLASLERVLALEPRRLLPAHGPAIDDPPRLITAYIAHRRMRERQIVDALRAGNVTVEAIAETIYDGLDPALMAAARENVRAHLEHLQSEGLAAEGDSGQWRL